MRDLYIRQDLQDLQDKAESDLLSTHIAGEWRPATQLTGSTVRFNEKVCIAFAHGCMRADAEISILFEYFQANNYELTHTLDDADLVVLVTCGFDSCAETVSLNLLNRAIRRKKDEARIIVTGCLAGIVDHSKISGKSDSPIAIIPPRSIEQFDKHIDCKVKFMDVMNNNAIPNCFVATDVRLSENQKNLISGISESYNPSAR